MPTYEYVCKHCGEPLEVVQSFSDAALTECPRCGGELRKVFGNVGIVFKGSGFYKTDSRSTSTSSTPANNGSSSESTTKTEEKKPAASTESTPPPTTTPAASTTAAST